jgi:hypothetical protein
MLDAVSVASPCSASWEDMVGDDRVRFCGSCQKNVFNLSAMTRGEAEALLVERDGDACVRLYRRADGRVLTSDCPVGVRRKRVRRVAGVAAALVGGGGGLALAASWLPQPTMGDMARPQMGGAVATPEGEVGEMGKVVPVPEAQPPVMGSVAPVPSAAPASPTPNAAAPKEPHVVGRIRKPPTAAF